MREQMSITCWSITCWITYLLT